MISRPGFTDWFGDGVFKDRCGRPSVFYHGTDSGTQFNVFSRTEESSIGFHFGDLAAAQARVDLIDMGERETGWGAIIPVYCNGARPLRLMDHHTWSLRNVCNELAELGIIDDDGYDLIEEACDEHAIFAAIELAGYDCVVYRNETENRKTPADSVIVWRAEMVKGVYAPYFRRGDPAIIPGFPCDPGDLLAWRSSGEWIDTYRGRLAALTAEAGAVPTPVS